MTDADGPTARPRHAWLWILAGLVIIAGLFALWWSANWMPRAAPMPAASGALAGELSTVADVDGEGWIAVAIGLSVGPGMTPTTAETTIGLLSPEGELTVMGSGGALSLEGRSRGGLDLTDALTVTPLAVSAEDRSVLVRIDFPEAYFAASLVVADLDTGNVARLDNCSASFLKMTDAGYLIYGDCGYGSEMSTVDYATGEIVEHYAAGVPDPWVWDERDERFIHIAGDYSECAPGGYLRDGRLVATCAVASAAGGFRAGAVEVGQEYVGEVALFDGELVPVGGDALAQGGLGFHALAVGDLLVANQSTTEGDLLLDVLGGDRQGMVYIDSSSVATITVRNGKILVVNGVDKYGAQPRNGAALYWYDPATGAQTRVAAVPQGTTYVARVPLAP